MPISDTWAGLSPMDSIASVGSCNSVTSSNSAFSDERLDYLSAEERECLMFLEETIHSLDTEEDRGVSTDELERTETPAKIGSILEKSTIQQPELAHGQPTEPDEKIPRAVSPNSNKNSTDSTSPQMARAKSGEYKIPWAVSPNRSKNNIDSTSPQMVQVKSGEFKIPRAVSPNRSKHSTDSTSPQMVRAKSGANTLPKYNPKLSTESKSTLPPSRLSESSRSPILSGDTRRRSHTALVQHQLVESKDKAKLGPPTAPKPRKLPAKIILKSCQKNDGPTVSRTNSPNSFKISKGAPRKNGHSLSREGSADGEVQQIRMEALSKLGLLAEPDGQKKPSQISLKTESASISQTATAGDDMKTNQPEVMGRDNKTNSVKYPSIGTGSPSNRSAASAVDPGVNGIANKPANVIVGNVNKVNKAQWQLGATKSSSLKRFNTAGESTLPTASLGSALNTAAISALGPGMSNTLPIARRSANVNEGQVKNINTAQWQFGATKTSSLKRFGTANDDSQSTLYPGVAQNTPGAAAAAVRPRPVSICSERDLSVRHGPTLEAVSSDKPGGKFFPIRINHISAKFQKSPPKGLNVQVTPQGPTSKDRTEALRKLGLLKE